MAGMPALRGIEALTLVLLAGGAEFRSVEQDATVFQRGSTPTGLYFVCAGGVKLLSRGPGNRTRVIELFEPGSMFGDIGVFTGSPYRTWTQVTAPALLIHVSRSSVLAAVHRDNQLATRMLATVAARTQRLIDGITATSPVPFTVRVAAYLTELDVRRDAEDEPLRLPASKSTVASMLNLAPESFSRALRRLMDAGIVSVTGRSIHIHDRRALRELISEADCPESI